MKRILIGGFHHESNSFSPIIAGEGDFKVLRGDEIFQHVRENDSISGIIATLQSAGHEVVPTVFTRAVPNGEVDYDFFQALRQEMMALARREQGRIDAITLALHGSMRVAGLGEAEGPILQDLRELFPDIPIFSSLDMHATMTDVMHHNCDGFAGYKTAPHTDCTETGILAARMTLFALEQNSLPKAAWVRVPMLIAGEKSGTDVSPMDRLMARLREIETNPDVLAASLLMGFPWADNRDSSLAVYIVTKQSQELADQLALDLANQVWDERAAFDFVTRAASPAQALEWALSDVASGLTPVYLSDSGDNPTAGASADNTDFAHLILQHPAVKGLPKPLIYAGFYDPAATRQCHGRTGQTIELRIGAAFDDSSQPLELTGQVVSYVEDFAYHDMPSGDLALFLSGNVLFVLAEKHIGFTSPDMFYQLGLDPVDHPIIICKLGYLTPQHQELAKSSILALTSGNTNQDLAAIDYRHIPRPIYPLDLAMTYQPAEHLKRGVR